MKDPHKLDPRAMHGKKQAVSWLHLGGSNPYHGTIMKDPHKLNPRAMERSKSCRIGLQKAPIWPKTAVSAHFHTSSLIAGPGAAKVVESGSKRRQILITGQL